MATPRRAAKKDDSSLAGARVLVVEARFYDDIADALLAGATRAFEQAGVAFDRITVPGALEIPIAAAIALDAAKAGRKPYDGVVALGCVIRGETGHYDIVAGESARALMDLAVARKLPLGNGILTVDTDAQAWERASIDKLDKGGGAAEAALALIQVARAGSESRKGATRRRA
jgi:6,7-dimethyl-8-ribityllumazine synthase